MNTLSFLAIVIIAGLLAGLVHGMLNIVIVEPYLDTSIGIENQRMFASGEAKDTPEFWQKFADYRIWQKQGSIIAGAILGVATGALFGLVFAYSRYKIPSQNKITTSMDIVNGFRMVSAITMTLYWIANAVILGALWRRFQPHITREQIQ